ncbi:tail fiber protein [Skermanella sp. TT6]|uniref:Tail fiber protein n=1 Tax=Skermanella cutis TaxID=2775420 RepID=A0ABX7B1U5_9PROT|nr:tail fiber protein [Skermanella sp. TT6]QQP88300.1 tail fiber protein [Skermanella sp. TT6]
MSNTPGSVPVGAILAIYGSSSSPPVGWLWCNGATFDGNQYPQLAALLPNLTLPDLTDRTLVGAGKSYTLGQTFGSAQVTLSTDQMPSHQHYGWGAGGHDNDSQGLGFGESSTGGYYGADGHSTDNNLYASTWEGGVGTNDIAVEYPDGSTGTTSSGSSDSNPIDVRQPSYAVNFIIYAGQGS